MKHGKNAKNSIFQTLNPFFLLFGGVVTKNAFSKMFLTYLVITPPTGFFTIKKRKDIWDCFDFFDVCTPSI